MGALGVGFGGFGLLAFFPFGTASFALFGAEVQVVSATKRRSFGELPATKRRQVRRPFVTKFVVSSPFAAWGFSFRLYARRGWAPPLRRFAARKSTSPKLRRFAVRKSPAAPTSPLRRAKVLGRTSPLRREKVHQTTRFSASPRRTFALRPGKEGGGDPISGGLRLRTAAQVQKIVRKKEMIFGVKSAFPKMTERIDSIGLSGAFEN